MSLLNARNVPTASECKPTELWGRSRGLGRGALVKRKLHTSPNFTWGQNKVVNPEAPAVLRVRRLPTAPRTSTPKRSGGKNQKRKIKEIFLQPHSLRKCHKYAIQYFHIITLDTQLNIVKYWLPEGKKKEKRKKKILHLPSFCWKILAPKHRT